MSRKKIILDTDPGVDDVLAILYALASCKELEILAITTVLGNIDLRNTTRNVQTTLNVIKADGTLPWMNSFSKISIAAGASVPLNAKEITDAGYFHGRDGLGGVNTAFPQYCPAKGWEQAYPALRVESEIEDTFQHGMSGSSIPCSPSPLLAHDEILSILSREEEDTVSIVAVGPLTNLSLAASKDYSTFSKAKEIVIMGGALHVPGNVTPVAEFNFLADPEACAHVLSLTSPTPSSTYKLSPDHVEKNLIITLLPLDTTTHLCLSYKAWSDAISSKKDTILAKWSSVFVEKTFETMRGLYTDQSIEKVHLSMHDPACIWYILSASESNGAPCRSNGLDEKASSTSWDIVHDEDIRIEIKGEWTRGMSVVDSRGREKIEEGTQDTGSDKNSWLHKQKGNRVRWVRGTPDSDLFVKEMLNKIWREGESIDRAKP